MRTKCLIVDDEPLAIVVIESYLDKLQEFEIVGKCDNAIAALDALRQKQVDLIFLDIQMPKLTGLEFLKTLQNPPKVIITTAYREYALEGYELDIIDYLIKPISFERFLKAINKFYKTQGTQNQPEPVATPAIESSPTDDEGYIFVKENKKMVKINLKDILFIESIKDYVKIQTTTKAVTTKQQISFYEETLDKDKFIRIHRSFIIAKDKIEAFNSYSIEIDKKELPIGRNYKPTVLEALNYKGEF